ncbi:MAG: DUF3592 domain-containing protein, partial [Acidobacteria bacterium]|nr:DUF3592 domain-containing protein [Acidobacteriota bacterium]
ACAFGTYIGLKTAFDLRANGVTVAGRVTEFETITSETTDGSVSGTYPTITYSDKSGVEHTFSGGTATPLTRLKVGGVVEVIYPAGNPARGMLNTWTERWLVPLFFAAMTIAFLMLFVFTLRGSIGSTGMGLERRGPGKTSGVPAIATVIEAKHADRMLAYRIDRDPRAPNAKLGEFTPLQLTIYNWTPSRSAAAVRKGDQFRAYLNPRKPGKNPFIDFSDPIGRDPHVRSFVEEDEEDDETPPGE